MTAKEWLNRGRKLNQEIDELIEVRNKAFDMACSCTSGASGERVQASKGNASEKKFINYIGYEEIINQRIDELVAIKTEILEAINKLQNPTYRTLLIARYINYKTWEKIAEDLQYKDVRQIYRIHKKCLNLMECH